MFTVLKKFFNKECRKFSDIMSDLTDKMKKSTNVVKKYEENAEVYELDTVDIIFEVTANKFRVMDKNGAQIISLDCHYDYYDQTQRAKWDLFGDFLKDVRNTYDKRVADANKLKEATAKMKKAEDAKQKVISAQQAKEKMLSDALEKLRGL